MNYKESIKKLRLKMMLSQEEFAKEIGVSFATVNRRETGKFVPTFKVQRKLKPYFDKYNIDIEVDE